jgi:hypothetical protein
MMVVMDTAAVIERVQCIAAVRVDAAAGREWLEAALRASAQLKAWLAAGDAELARRLKDVVSFPEKTIADCTRGSLGDAVRAGERADTLAAVPAFADALNAAAVTAGHVDAITKRAKGLTGEQRSELHERAAHLVPVATDATVAEFGKRLDLEVRAIQRDDGRAKLERQRRAVSLRSWTDTDGMYCFTGRIDPVTAVPFAARLDAEIQAAFAETTPDTCPIDPVDKQRHLAGLAIIRLITGTATASGTGRPEYVVVIDTTQTDGAGGSIIDWGIPVEIPARILADMIGDADIHTVVVRNGIVLHAPGTLNLGRAARLANRAQRRALRGLYATCAIPGCSVHFDRCKIHHIVPWEQGGTTDLANLLPVCAHHHTHIHEHRWAITLGPNRELTLTLPDGTIHNTGPPTRRVA